MTVTVAIVGRPNVGKSTLFNRLAGRRLAIVDDTPGVTRDRREGEGRLGDLAFRIVDTAGFEDARGDDLAARIQAQTARALSEADVVLFMVDARAGLTPLDHELAQLMRRESGSVVLIANKCEGRAGQTGLAEAWALGLGQPIPFSAEHAEGIGHLYDALVPFFPEADDDPLHPAAAGETTDAGMPANVAGNLADDPRGQQALQLAVIGRPNVGKSTLINRLIGVERLVTGPEAGITRDSIGIDWTFRGRTLRLFDTAGLRRRAKIDDRLEELAGADTLRAVRFAHVVVIVIDATTGIEKQDLTIIDLTANEGRAPILAANKWDLIEDRKGAMTRIRERLETSMPQLRGLRVVPLSALTGGGLDKLLPEVLDVYDVWNRKLGTPRLNRWLGQMTARQAPPSSHGRPVKIRYMVQTKARPPTFVLFANRPEEVPEAYLRYLAGGLREGFDLQGIPLRLSARRSRNPYATQP